MRYLLLGSGKMKNKKAVMSNLLKWILWFIVFLALLVAVASLGGKL